MLEEARSVGRDLPDLVVLLSSYINETTDPPGEESNIQRLESDRTAVQIMTIHKSKGLEAAVVFVYGGFGRFRAGGMHAYHEAGERILYVGDDDAAKQKADAERTREEQRLYYVALTRAKARLYLPLIPEKLGGKRWDGGYRRLNDRLCSIVNNLETPAQRAYFEIIPFHDRPLDLNPDRAGEQHGDLRAWRASDVLKKNPPRSPNFSVLKQNHAGYMVSSYSRMKQIENSEINPLERDAFRREPSQKSLPLEVAEDELPGGTATGTMLHEVLENIPPVSLDSLPSLSEWLDRDEVKEVFMRALARNGLRLTPPQRQRAAEAVYRALTMPIPLGAGRSIPGLYGCRHVLSEMEFLFPFPEDTHPSLLDPRPGKLEIERGYIKGFVDLVVLHEDRVYFADWKSDMLLSYEPDLIAAHVGTHYSIQIRLYSLALVRALKINSEAAYEEAFGGLFYVFLRALTRRGTDDGGVHFERPSWADILKYEDELKRFDLRSGKGRT